MQVQLTKEHREWLQAQVDAGRYSSLEEAVADAIDGLRQEDEELAWAKPLVTEGIAQLDRGEAVSADEVFQRLEARLLHKRE
jgi:antitoxin ParD1/3/4